MDQLRLQQAVTRILTSYLASHQIEVGQVSGLVTSVGQALSTQRASLEAEAIAPLVRRLRRRADKSVDPGAQRIENPDQPDMFGESEAGMASAPIGETAEADAETAVEDGVTVTRIPEVRRSRKR